MVKLLFIGDIVGKPGRDFIKEKVPQLRSELELDFVIANGENAAGGAGISGAMAKEIMEAGVDAITLGDHVWDQRGFDAEIGEFETMSRPANLPKQCPGRTYIILEKEGVKLGIFTVLGRTFMRMTSDCPFAAADAILKELIPKTDIILAEMHAETTSEKIAYGWYLDGRVSTVVGTHTHIPTADATILPRGTAFLTDAGMTGPYESILGREVEPIVLKFLDGMPRRWPVATNDLRLCGFYVEINPENGIATKCQQMTIV